MISNRLKSALLAALERNHAPEEVEKALELVRPRFARWSFDLIARTLVKSGQTIVAVEEPGFPPMRVPFAAAGARVAVLPNAVPLPELAPAIVEAIERMCYSDPPGYVPGE